MILFCQALTNFSCHITAARPAPLTNDSFFDIVSHIDKNNLVAKSANVRTVLTAMLDDRSAQIQAALTRLANKMEQLDACVPGHPLVETFLRSSEDWMVYDHFEDFNSASTFALKLTRERAKRGYLIRTETYKANGRTSIDIRKLRTPACVGPDGQLTSDGSSDDVLRPDQLHHELEELKKIRQKHGRQSKQLPPPGQVTDHGCASITPPPAKRAKFEMNGNLPMPIAMG